VDFAAEGLLDGLDAEARTARLELLQRMADAGVPLEELKQAVVEDRLAVLPVELVMDGAGGLTAVDIAKQTGLDVAFVLANRQALGLPGAEPDDPVFYAQDLEALKATRAFLDAGIPAAGLLETARVLGQGMAHFADATRTLVAETFLRPGASEQELGLQYAAVLEQLGPRLAPVYEAAFAAQLREQLRTTIVGAAERESGRLPGAQDVVVCFADLVGFTRLGGRIPADELGGIAGRLSLLAADVAVPPVRLIKTIGDAAMLVSRDAPALVEAALDLVEAAAAEEQLPSLRAGLAAGPALNRGGDWYGHPVNLASRVTGVARPDSVLVTEDVREAAGDRFKWSYAGRPRLKGVTETVALHRARPLPAD
jgi:adenylate cyclase